MNTFKKYPSATPIFVNTNDCCIPKNEIIFFLENLYIHARLEILF